MSPELGGLEMRVNGLLCPLDAEQTQRRPTGRPEKWSMQQIVEHLRLTYRSTCEVFEARVRKGTPTQATATLPQRVARFTVMRLRYLPNGRRSPEAVCPADGPAAKSGEELADGFREDLARMDEWIARAETLFGERRAISHQVLGPLSAREWRVFHLLHGLHHLKQMETIRKQTEAAMGERAEPA